MNYRLGSIYAVVTALLVSTQEPFSFPAAKHLSLVQFVFVTQVALLISVPLLVARSASRRDLVALLGQPRNYWKLAILFAVGMSGLVLFKTALSNAHPIIISAIVNLQPFWAAMVALHLPSARPGLASGLFRLPRRRVSRRNDRRLELSWRSRQAGLEGTQGKRHARHVALRVSGADLLGAGRHPGRQMVWAV